MGTSTAGGWRSAPGPPVARLCAGIVVVALGGSGAQAAEEPVPRRPGDGYHDLAAIESLFAEWCASSRVAPVDLGRTRGGLPVPAIQLGAPGPVPLEERPTVLLVGGVDGVSFAGGEAVLRAAHALLACAPLRDDVTFVAVPWASPDALAAAFEGRRFDGCNAAALDRDGDGTVGEDGPDDLDGDGRILDMLFLDPDGPWTLADDERFLVPARPEDGERYRRVREGRDDDGDGRFNEDAGGGVELDASFPVGWRAGGAGGRWPLSEPLARALADLVLARRTVLVLCAQGNHGRLARPGGLFPESPGAVDAAPDAATFDRLARAFAVHARRPLGPAPALADARGAERPGAFVDWCYAVPGVPAVEVAPWGPGAGGRRPAPSGGRAASVLDPLRVGPPARPSDRLWAAWLDEVRGGIGFVPWHAVELGQGRRGLVGGWEPRTLLNPPEDALATAVAGFPELVLELARGLPRLHVQVVEAEREGELVRLRARAANPGALPTAVATTGRWEGARAGDVELSLELPPGARLLAGSLARRLPPLAGGESSAVLEWTVLAREGSRLVLRARSPWCADAIGEVCP